MGKTLIRGACVLTMGRFNLPRADILIDGTVIAEIGTGIRARDAEVIEADDMIVMPGFVDAHRHTWESLLRNLGDDSGAADDYRDHYEPEDVYAATLVGLLSALEAGTTTVVDWFGIDGGDDHAQAALQAHVDAGVRSVLAYAGSAATADTWAERLRRLADHPIGPLQTIAAGVPDRVGSDASTIAADMAFSREQGMRVHAHAGVGGSAAGTVTELAGRGALGDDVTLVHCCHLDDADLDAVATTSTEVVVAPSSEMAGGLGEPPLQRLIDRGIRPGLGIDSERLAPGDLFAQMRAAISLQHAAYFDLKLAGKAGLPRLLTTRDVIRYATIDGARASGLGGGVLDEGAPADLILLDTNSPNIHPINDPVGAVVWGMDTSNVSTVFVDGRAVKRDGALVDVDAPAVMEAAVKARDAVAGRAGINLVGSGVVS